ncbi:MAG: hypothetical protein M0Q46_05355 [Endomicrobiales bacterium]|nr:hypothetical protein [Endomicrobiales bacterium]
MIYEVKKFNLVSMLKLLPAIFAIVPVVIGLFTFFILTTEVAAGLGTATRLISWLIFVVLYTVIMLLGITVIALLYNWLSNKIGGIVVTLEEKK